jgi:5-methylcytosine-specific restriction endonuclease McrA
MPKKTVKPRVERTRCSGTKTEAGMVSWVLSYLRKMTLRWKPRFDRLNDGREKRPLGTNGREVWANTCEKCKKWYKTSDLAMDHIVPIGGLKSLDEAGRWLKMALVEIDGYQRLCKKCHDKKTADERSDK